MTAKTNKTYDQPRMPENLSPPRKKGYFLKLIRVIFILLFDFIEAEKIINDLDKVNQNAGSKSTDKSTNELRKNATSIISGDKERNVTGI